MTKTCTKVLNLTLQASDVKNSVKTFQLSKKYVKRLTKISLLNIVYRRIDISQKEFESKKYENVPYVVFKRKSQNKFIKAYHAIGAGIIDAIEKDYLKEISVHIIRKKTREPLETYNIKVKYNKEATKSDQKPELVKEATTEFLKALTELPGEKWNEENVELFTELSYNDDTPKEYEPPNFEAAKEVLSTGINKFVIIGKVNTGFHKISTWGRGKNFMVSRASTPAPVKESPEVNINEPTLIEDSDEELDEIFKETKGQDISCVNVTLASSEEHVNCVCRWNMPENFENIKCTKCYESVHLACHGFMSSKAVNKKTFSCLSCSVKNVDGNLMMMVKLRAILYGIYVNQSFPRAFQFAAKKEKKFILEKLEQFGIEHSTGSSLGDIGMEGLNKAISVVFQSENSQFLE